MCRENKSATIYIPEIYKIVHSRDMPRRSERKHLGGRSTDDLLLVGVLVIGGAEDAEMSHTDIRPHDGWYTDTRVLYTHVIYFQWHEYYVCVRGHSICVIIYLVNFFHMT